MATLAPEEAGRCREKRIEISTFPAVAASLRAAAKQFRCRRRCRKCRRLSPPSLRLLQRRPRVAWRECCFQREEHGRHGIPLGVELQARHGTSLLERPWLRKLRVHLLDSLLALLLQRHEQVRRRRGLRNWTWPRTALHCSLATVLSQFPAPIRRFVGSSVTSSVVRHHTV